jgi:hypothetical protein
VVRSTARNLTNPAYPAGDAEEGLAVQGAVRIDERKGAMPPIADESLHRSETTQSARSGHATPVAVGRYEALLLIENGVDREPIAVSESVRLIGHTDHRHHLAEHFIGHGPLLARWSYEPQLHSCIRS